jgi:hypothetical protein
MIGVLVALMGWLMAVVLVVGAVTLAQQGRATLDRLQQERRENRRQSQLDLTQKESVSAAQQQKLEEAIKAELTAQEKVQKETAQARNVVSRLQTEKTAQETKRERLKAGDLAVKGDVEVMGEGIQELQAKFTALQKEKSDLVKEYVERYRRMKKNYEERLARPESEMMRQFYQKHQNTPFAPAALFFTAEKLYQKRRSADAQRFYEDLVRKYPDSAYVQPAQKRISDIQGHIGYEPIEGLGFTPYKALRLADNL